MGDLQLHFTEPVHVVVIGIGRGLGIENRSGFFAVDQK